jgi:hypothetical protein
MKKIVIILAVLSLAAAFTDTLLAKTEIEGKEVHYSAVGVVMKGYLV